MAFLLVCKRITHTAAFISNSVLKLDLGWKQILIANPWVIGFQGEVQDFTCIKSGRKIGEIPAAENVSVQMLFVQPVSSQRVLGYFKVNSVFVNCAVFSYCYFRSS